MKMERNNTIELAIVPGSPPPVQTQASQNEPDVKQGTKYLVLGALALIAGSGSLMGFKISGAGEDSKSIEKIELMCIRCNCCTKSGQTDQVPTIPVYTQTYPGVGNPGIPQQGNVYYNGAVNNRGVISHIPNNNPQFTGQNSPNYNGYIVNQNASFNKSNDQYDLDSRVGWT